MMRLVRIFGFSGMAFAVLLLAAGAAQAQTKSKSRTAAAEGMRAAGGTHVYLLRGWLDVFSTGMDDLTAKLNRRGIRATVHGHAEYHSLADSIASRYRAGRGERVVIIGHSLGANAAIEMAARLGEMKVPVPLVITYDPTVTEHVPGNVSRLVNFYQSNNGWGSRVERGPGFRGQLSNIDLARESAIDHVSIDKSNKLHIQTIGYIQSLGSSRPAAELTPSAAGAAQRSQLPPFSTGSSGPQAIPVSAAQPRIIDQTPRL